MKRRFIVIVGLSLALVGLAGPPLARAQAPVVYDDESGANGDCRVTGSSDDQMVFCSDMRPGKGAAVTTPGEAAPAPKAAPKESPKAAPDEAAAPESSDAAVASATDQDADNAPDELEPGLGLDPSNPDTDADNVADGDELNIYGTDPLNADTDGDGKSDGEELFATHTDPLVWDDFGAQDAGDNG